jgi:hypothetical protein
VSADPATQQTPGLWAIVAVNRVNFVGGGEVGLIERVVGGR